MLSITSNMDEYDIAQEVKMERMVHKGSFLLVEGKTDVKRFRPFLSLESCSIVNCQSGRKADAAIRILDKKSFKGAVAIIDADFSKVKGINIERKNLLISENHDLDLDWIKTSVLERYLNEVSDLEKVEYHGGSRAIVNTIHETLRPVSTGRFLNSTRKFSFKTSGINVAEFYSHGEDLCSAYVSSLVGAGYVDESKSDWIEIEIKKEMMKPKDDWQMTNGHDLCGALGKILRNTIGTRKPQQCWASEIESHIRLTINKDDFVSLKIFSDVKEWENKNDGYVIFCPSLCI